MDLFLEKDSDCVYALILQGIRLENRLKDLHLSKYIKVVN